MLSIKELKNRVSP